MHDYDEQHFDSDFSYEEDHASLSHRKYLRRRLEKKYEHQWLKKELEDYEGELDEFDWSEFDKD